MNRLALSAVHVGVVATLVLGVLTRPASTVASSPWPAERNLILAASHRLQWERTPGVVAWLRSVPIVASSAVGQDGRTVMVRFRDGMNAAVLPASAPPTPSRGLFSDRENVRSRPATPMPVTGQPRALVLEPFASELNLGPQAGKVEADDLQAAGYRVDRLVDGAVTMGTMSTLANYNVVYILTHSGVNQWGEGVVATGELANTDPAMDPLIKEFSVLVVGVVGTKQLYYGIMSRYIQYHVGRFPAHSLMFINGCSMLSASLFWKALASKGMGAMVSWDHDGLAVDDVPAGDDFFGAMYRGRDVTDALAAVRADGHGTSQPAGGPIAHIGYLGDGSITLQSASGLTPTATPVVTAAVHNRAPRLTLRKQVVPGQGQRISVVSAPDAWLRITVINPDGTRHIALRVAGVRGRSTYAYRQPSSVITPWQTHARVVVTDVHHHLSAIATYNVGAGLFDLHLGKMRVAPGGHVTFWLYSRRPGTGRVDVRYRGRILSQVPLRLAAGHWSRVLYTVPRSLAHVGLQVLADLFGVGSATQPLAVR